MKRTLGLDLGTNSIGWAIVEEEGGARRLFKAGSVIFPEGVARVKGNEQPSTLSRTRSRSTRRLYFRRRMRKQKLLRALIANGMCPLSQEGLDLWTKKEQYPNEPAFTEWFKSNPYELRAKGLDDKLSLLELGRVLYHFAQRRGFKSNRKAGGDGEQATFNEGIPDRGIKGYRDTLRVIEENGGTLGKAGVALAEKNEGIRRRFVRRTDLEKELKLIWDAQKEHHPNVLSTELEKLVAKPKESVVFFQRPLKSKKGTVGRCTLEPSKPRAPISSIEAELFSILHTINTIKVDGRMLNERERNAVLPRFFLKKTKVAFAEIEKELKKIGTTGAFKFSKDVNFTSSRTITWLAALWKVDALDIVRVFTTSENPAQRKEWEDRWSAVYNAEDFDELSDVKAAGGDTGTQRDLKEYAQTKWGFDEDQLKSLQNFKCKQGYHSLSRKALRRIIPYLYRGIPYHDAVLMAGAQAVFGEQWKQFSDGERAAIERGINEQIDSQRMARTKTILTNGLVRRYRDEHGEDAGKLKWDASWNSALDKTIEEGLDRNTTDELGVEGIKELRSTIEAEFKAHVQRGPVKFIRPKRIDERVKNWLADNFPIGQKALDRLYHHSAIETYPHTKDMLRSPARRGVNNPMVMRAMHQLRKLANRLIELDWVDASTQVNIEMARELDSANRRKAWERYQRELEKENAACEQIVRDYFAESKRFTDPSKDEVLRVVLYREAEKLWGEAKCVFTGERIGGIKDLFDSGDWEIEHIWPRSKTNDNSKANKILCLKEYNTTVKRDRLPPYLPNYDKEAMAAGKMRASIVSMLEPIESTMDGYQTAVNIRKENSKRATTKEEKDRAIQERWYFQFKLDYWRTRYEHLTAKEIKPGFLNRQLVATGQITRLAREYMHSYFNKVVSYKPEALTSFRRAWLGERYDEGKDRDLHTHHAKDAAVAATVSRELFDALAHYYEEKDDKNKDGTFVLPWKSFPTDMKALEEGAVVIHAYVDALGRISRYRRKMPDGTVHYATGDTVRGSLHKDTYYGRIKLKKEGTDEYEEHTVLRRPVRDMSKADYAKVVDPMLRKKLQEADPEVIIAKEGLPVMVSGKEQIVKRVRTFEKSVKNPVPIKAHRNQKDGAEHKHWLWVKNDETPLMAIYENEKGRRTHYVFSLLELTKLLKDAEGRHQLLSKIPREHPVRAGFHLVEREGKPYVLRVGQEVVLYAQDPDEIRWDDLKDMNNRTYVIRKLEGDGRINLVNVLDARRDDELDEVNTWDPTNSRVWLRMSVHGMKGLVVGLDKSIDPVRGVV